VKWENQIRFYIRWHLINLKLEKREIMVLKEVLYLKNSVEEYRKKLNQIIMDKGINHPDSIKFSQELDNKVLQLQKYMVQICN
jgi:Spo0E like sporulation regulatory protein